MRLQNRPLVSRFCAIGLLLCVTTLCLSGCGSGGQQAHERYATLSSAAAALSAHVRRETRFQAEAFFRGTNDQVNSSILYSVNGQARCDESEQWASQSYTAVWLGASSRGEDLFQNNSCVHTENGEETVTERDTGEALHAFPFRSVWVPAETDLANIEAADGQNGMIYSLTMPGTASVLQDLCGMDWYALAQIREPEKEKESVGMLELTYTVSDGIVRSFAAECTVQIFEKAGYTPGYSKPDADGLTLTLRVQWSYTALDEAVSGPAGLKPT